MKSFFINQRTFLWLTLVGGLCTLCSCKKFLDLPASPDLVETDAVFAYEETAVAAVTGVYNQMRMGTDFSNGGLSIYGGLAADELLHTTSNATNDAFFKNALLPNTGAVHTNYWAAAYKNIYRANAVLEGLSRSHTLSETLKKQLAGEMRVVRALNYFYLVNLFGPVPLVRSTEYTANALLPRASVDSIYQFISEDLSEAKGQLSADYASAGKGRPNLWTARALLSRIYLFQGQWSKAEEEASAVIGSGMYGLVSTLNAVFLAGSNETIWELASDNNPTSEGFRFIPASATGRPTYTLSSRLLDSFEAGDLRRSAWVKTNTVGGTPYSYPYKYKLRFGTPITEYNVVMRLAELYLIRAEARAHLEDPEAVTDLNMVRNRAGLPGYSGATDKVSLLLAIEQERQVELFAEWGHRWLDLKRTGKADQVLGIVKGANWQSTDALFPVPQTELDRNPSLTQNPGY